MRDGMGALIPVELVADTDALEDECVRTIAHHAQRLASQVARFKGHTYDDLGNLDAARAEEGFTKGGAKGNKTYYSLDAQFKVSVRVQPQHAFGAQITQAKEQIDVCLNEWSAGARPEIRALITDAFNTDNDGQINRTEIYRLMRLKIEDARWVTAMKTLREAMRVIGSKTYLTVHKRQGPEDDWQQITINLAKA